MKRRLFWWRKAAEQGYAQAQYNLGVMYAEGEGVTRDYEKVVEWWQQAADQGFADAQYNLGWLYYYGEGVPTGLSKSGCFGIKKLLGKTITLLRLGWVSCLPRGYGVRQDDEKAMEWYQKAEGQIKKDAERGDDYAQYTLGWLYAQGGGANPSMQQAIKWLRKAAEQGSSFAQDELKRLEQNN